MSFIMFTLCSSLRPLNSFRNFSWSKCFKSFLCGLTFSLLRTDRSSKIRKFGKWSELFSRSLSLLHCKSLKFKHILSLVDHENDNEVKITNVIKSATSDITDAELTLVTKQIQKSCNQKVKYQKAVPETIKKEGGMYAKVYGTASAIKKFWFKYAKYNFNRTTVNSWKAKCKNANPTFEKTGRPNLLDETLLKKLKDIAIGKRAAGGVTNRKQILHIAKGVVRANNPSALKEFGGSLGLTNRWARDVLKQLKWSKRKGTTGKVDTPPQFLAEEKFSFQRKISTTILEHDIPTPLNVNIDQTLLSFVSPGKYTFSFKGAKNVPKNR